MSEGLSTQHSWQGCARNGDFFRTPTFKFIGIVADKPFESFLLTQADGGDKIGIDNLTYGDKSAANSIPEPATLALAAIGFLTCYAIRQRR